MARFTGTRIIITGASAGIGEAAARRFVDEGGEVVLAARRAPPLVALAEQLGGTCHVITADVGDPASCRALIEESAERMGGIDVLVNNAGSHVRGDFETRTAEDFATMVDVNLRGPILLSRHAIDVMRSQGRGSIINVASLAGRIPLPGAVVYSSTKFGLRAFSLALAEELRGTDIKVSLVSPGPVDTGFLMGALDTVSPLALSQPMSTADEIAALVIDAAVEGRLEYVRPRASGALATLGYLAPPITRALRPLLRRKGERAKAKYLRERGK